jgi:hypothetical protein
MCYSAFVEFCTSRLCYRIIEFDPGKFNPYFLLPDASEESTVPEDNNVYDIY